MDTKQLEESLSTEAFEYLEDAIAEYKMFGFDDEKESCIRQIALTMYELGQREEAAANLESNELVLEAMQKSVDDTTFSGADLMAWIFLLNEYGGTPGQEKDTGRIFTTLHLPTVGAALREYDTLKFMLPDGMVEYQIIRKDAAVNHAPASEE